jgi:NADH:ubiquinone oxidoreductase subunit 3 (subunit A)
MPTDLLLTPPVAFAILLAGIGLFAILSRSLAPKSDPGGDKGEPYACGQDVPTGRIQPGYGFFQVAFAFTIFEVVALLLGTGGVGSVWLALLVLGVVGLAVVILFRKD